MINSTYLFTWRLVLRGVHRQNVEVKNADSKKCRCAKRRKKKPRMGQMEWEKRRMGQNVEWKKRRLGQNVEK